MAKRKDYSKLFSALPNPDSILRKTGKTIVAYRELLQDAHLWSCVQSRKSGILSLDYRIVQGESSEFVKKEIELIFNSLDVQSIISDILEAPLYGWQPIEIVWDFIGKVHQIAVPIKICAKPQEWFCFNNDGDLIFIGDKSAQGIKPPEYKFICPKNSAGYLNPYGHSLLSKCYWSVIFKNTGLKNWVNFSEKYGMPILMGQYTRGSTNEEAERLALALAQMTEDSVIVAPADINITLHEAVRSTSVELYKELIKYCNAEISKALLSQTLTTELDMGSYAAAQTHYKVRKEVIQSDIKLVESSLNKIIQYIVDLNFGANYPKFQIILNDSDNSQRLERDTKLISSDKIRLTKKYWQNAYGFNDDEIDIV
jgi:phage gp29-like protein